MKSARLSGPWWLWFATALIVLSLGRAGWRLQQENEALKSALAPVAPSQPAARDVPPVAAPEAPEPRFTAEDLRAETAREIAMRTALEAKIAALEKRLPPGDEVLVSFGRIDEMGRRAAKAVSFLLTQTQPAPASGAKPLAESPEEVKSFFTDFLGQIGELRALEDEPREIARFQSAALRDLFGLDDAAARGVGAILEGEFARLKAQGLHAGARPAQDAADWDRRRDAAITAAAARLQPVLPPNHALLPLAPGILSLGGGLRTEVKMNADGHGSVNMTLPLFPKMPGL